jgi:hypothetical protein
MSETCFTSCLYFAQQFRYVACSVRLIVNPGDRHGLHGRICDKNLFCRVNVLLCKLAFFDFYVFPPCEFYNQPPCDSVKDPAFNRWCTEYAILIEKDIADGSFGQLPDVLA